MSNAIPKETWERSQSQGSSAENAFVKMMKERGRPIREASREQNMFDHVDYFVEGKSGRVVSFDVKAFKGQAERGYILLEFKNVKGNKGWLYGKADMIAFQQGDGRFLCVNRDELVMLGERLCDLTVSVNRIGDALYKSYTRSKWGRDDLVSLIKFEDLTNNCKTFTL